METIRTRPWPSAPGPAIGPAATRRDRPRWRRISGAVAVGALVGVARMGIASSIAALVFAGSLGPYVAAGIGLALVSETVALVGVALLGSIPGAVAGVHPTPAASAAVMAAGIAGAVAAPEPRFLTVVLALGVTTALTGAALLVIGRLGLGDVVRLIPFPVVAGFIAGTGWLLVTKSFDVLVSEPVGAASRPLLSGGAVEHWAPGVAFGLALLAVARLRHSSLAVPAGIAVGIALFYGSAVLAGAGTAEIEAGGWVLGPVADGTVWSTWTVQAIDVADWSVLPAHVPAAAALTCVAVLAMLLNVTAIELTTGRDADLERELRSAGSVNIVSGLAGGLVSLPIVAQTSLAHRLGAASRLVPCVAAIVPVAALLAGPALITRLPRPVLGGLLFFIGAMLLLDWLVTTRVRVSAWEYAVIVAIVLVVATLGFLAGVVVGLLLALVLFVVEYSRTDSLRHVMDGRSFASAVERSPHDREILYRQGGEREYWRLQGFLFFGTADRLVRRAHERADSPVPLRFLVIDFTLATGVDSSAALCVASLQRLAAGRGFTLVLCGLGERLRRRLGAAVRLDPAHAGTRWFPELDQAVQWCEEQTLEQSGARAGDGTVPLAVTLGPDLHRRLLRHHLKRLHMTPGAVLVRQGELADELYFVESGVLTATVQTPAGRTMRVRTMVAGAVVGEVAALSGGPRTASVIAETNCTLCRLTRSALDDMVRDDPEVAALFHRWLARRMADRLADNLRTMRALLD